MPTIAAPAPIPAFAPVERPLFGEGVEVAVVLPREDDAEVVECDVTVGEEDGCHFVSICCQLSV